jgi:hypothetical protein
MKSLGIAVTVLAVAASSYAQFNKTTVLMSGKVRDAESNQLIRARLQYYEGATEANQVLSNTQAGYQAVLKPGTAYTVKLVSERYYTAVEPVSVAAVDKFTQCSQDFTMKPIHDGTVMYSGDVFEYGSVTARPEAATVIMNLGKRLKDNYEIEVRVDAGADKPYEGQAVPSDQGTQRVNAIKAMLIANGASRSRVQINATNPAVVAAAQAQAAPQVDKKKGKKGKKEVVKKEIVKKEPKKKPAKKGKKEVAAPSGPPSSAATITIIRVHSLDD